MNQITLHVESPHVPPRSVWIQNEHIVHVGSSSLVDLSIPDDRFLSEAHFAVRASNGVCSMLDLGSDQGTWVNGRSVKQFVLSDRDTILAGESRFVVNIHGESRPRWSPGYCATESRDPLAGGFDVAPPRWRSRRLESGAVEIAPIDAGELTLSEILEKIGKASRLTSVINRQALGWNAADAFPELSGRVEIQPFICVVPSDVDLVLDLIGRTSGCEGILVAISDEPDDQVLKRLQGAATSYSSSGIFQAQVAQAPAPFLKRIFDGVDGVVIPAVGADWRMLVMDLGCPCVSALGHGCVES